MLSCFSVVQQVANWGHRPKILGEAPETRFRHTAVVAPLAPGSPLHDAVTAQLTGLGVAAAAESGTLLLLWGGYNTHNAQFGGPDIQVILAFCVHSGSWIGLDRGRFLLTPAPSCPAAAGDPLTASNAVVLVLMVGNCVQQGLWVAEGARTVAWLPLTSTGEAPSCRFHHTADAFAGAPAWLQATAYP